MLVSILPVPFANAARQRQYEAVLAALRAEEGAPATVLLGNLAAFTPVLADLLVVQPTGLALGVLLPHAGQLTVPALAYGPWQLDGQPLPGREEADNPFAQYQQQLPLALAWLSEHLHLPADELPPCLGIALFEAPLTFGPGVEAQLHHHPDAAAFELVGGAAQVPGRLRWQPAAGASLNEEELLEWGEYLANEPYVLHNQGVSETLTALFKQKLWQLWRWLGAEDIPADPPYGAPLPDQHLRDQQEQARLRQLRQELQAELHQQRQEATIREAARTQELALLRQELAQASSSATERQAEQQAKAALEESLRTARAELATRNQELDARIQQLGQLIEQLQVAPAASPPAGPVAAGPSANAQLPSSATAARPAPVAKRPRPSAAPAGSFRRLRQAERWGLVLLAAAGAGAGTWGVVRWAQPLATRSATVAPRRLVENAPTDTLAGDPSTFADSLAHAQTAADTLPTADAEAPTTDAEMPTDGAGPTTDETPTADEATAPTSPTVPTPAATETTAPAEPAAPSPSASPSPNPTTPETSPTP